MRLFTLIVASVIAAAVWLPSMASAAIDPTGVWNLTFTGGFNANCSPATITLYVNQIAIAESCSEIRNLDGTFNKGDGSFSISGETDCAGYFNVPFNMNGTFAPNGQSMSGTWNSICFGNVGGSFSGTKKGPLPTMTATPTSTRTPTATQPLVATNTPPPPTPVEVGGVSRDLPGGGSDGGFALPAALATGAAIALAVSGGAWYALRRTRR